MEFLGTSFRIGRVFGINVRIHILFLIWIGFELIRSGSGDRTDLALFYAGLFAIVLLHEFGHCFGARAVGGDAENIILWPLGGLAFADAPMTPWAQFVTVVSGPLVNLVFCLVSGAIIIAYFGWASASLLLHNPFGALYLPDPRLGWIRYAYIFYEINYFLLAFNILPIYPMDGGQLFQCLLWPFLGVQQAIRTACLVGIIGCAGLGLWGMSGNGGGMLIFIAIFGAMTCFQRLQMLRYGTVVDERYSPRYRVQNPRRRGLLARMFKLKPRGPARERPIERLDPIAPARPPNPPLDPEAAFEVEVDRILKKVSREGIRSLSYVERQMLERATRRRRQQAVQADDTHES